MKKCLIIFLMVMMCWPAFSQQFVFVFLNKKEHPAEPSKEELAMIMDGHMANIKRLANENKLLAAGPFEGGGGIFIFRSGSIQEVAGWLSTDPGIQAKRWDIEIFNYKTRIGSVCPVGEPIEMTFYHFVRFGINITKYTMSAMADEMQKHDQYLQQLAATGNVIEEGTFGLQEGGILVMKGDLRKELIEQDPAVQTGFLDLDIKKLYIAKGSFCEK